MIIKRLGFRRNGHSYNGYLFGVNPEDGEDRFFFDLYNFGLLFCVDTWEDHDSEMFYTLDAEDEDIGELEN